MVDLRRILNRLGTARNARSDRWSLIAKLKQDIRNISAPCVEERRHVKQRGENLNLTRQIEEKEARVETYFGSVQHFTRKILVLN